jgi:hypothetical protein
VEPEGVPDLFGLGQGRSSIRNEYLFLLRDVQGPTRGRWTNRKMLFIIGRRMNNEELHVSYSFRESGNSFSARDNG